MCGKSSVEKVRKLDALAAHRPSPRTDPRRTQTFAAHSAGVATHPPSPPRVVKHGVPTLRSGGPLGRVIAECRVLTPTPIRAADPKAGRKAKMEQPEERMNHLLRPSLAFISCVQHCDQCSDQCCDISPCRGSGIARSSSATIGRCARVDSASVSGLKRLPIMRMRWFAST